jgi:hypothetical protein
MMNRWSNRVAGCLGLLLGLVCADRTWAQGALTNGAVHTGVISSAGELDSWTFNAPAGAAIVVRVGEIGGDSDLYPWLRVYGPTGTVLSSVQNGHAVEAAVTAPSAGTYTVVVASNDTGNDATGDYTLNLALIPGSPVVSGGDEGGGMTNGLNHTGQIHVGDLDQWTFTAPAGAAIIVRMGEIDGDSELYPWLRIYSPTGTLLSSVQNGQAVEAAVTAPSQGT